ncbi:MAG: CatB-related O-acetyltransferase [Lachnospiraceae bacterium]|nr:CatB-related O-acetyltransferase [Lachnospiraceae bacterium]
MKQGSCINKGTRLSGRNYIGKNTVLSNVRLGFGSYVNNDGDITNTRIGKYTSIGPGVKTVIGKHPVTEYAALHPAFYSAAGQMGFTYVSEDNYREAEYLDEKEGIQIEIGNDVWIGADVRILEGVTIGDGAVIGACSLVTKDIPPYSVCLGTPAKPVKYRFSPEKIRELLRLRWWDKDEKFIKEHIESFRDADRLIRELKAGPEEDG